jgi:hypothetical protein
MSSSDWAFDGGSSSPSVLASEAAAGTGSTPARDEIADRTAVITARLKTIYRKVVLPVEKRYQYDYFYESPFLSDSEFDGTRETVCMSVCLCVRVGCNLSQQQQQQQQR